MTTNPIARGSLLAIAAAVLFGLTTPVVKHFGEATGPFATAALLYGGAAAFAGLSRGRSSEARLGRAELGRLAVVALLGAVAAPAALAWGLQRTSAVGASLLLNFEAVFTVALARLLYREFIGRRVGLAVALMLVGGTVLAVRAGGGGPTSAIGLAAILGATLAWALDNTLTRPLADFDPVAVVFGKAAMGSALSVAIALLRREAWPGAVGVVALLACGAAGYGASLRLYLSAQRALGAARTGSLFAFAPFVGAAVSFALGDYESPVLGAAAAGVFGLAVYLHATEKHGHLHRHAPVEHEHAHSHDEPHHAHAHDPPVQGVHSHVHRHEPLVHDHPHGADLHHRHEHD